MKVDIAKVSQMVILSENVISERGEIVIWWRKIIVAMSGDRRISSATAMQIIGRYIICFEYVFSFLVLLLNRFRDINIYSNRYMPIMLECCKRVLRYC